MTATVGDREVGRAPGVARAVREHPFDRLATWMLLALLATLSIEWIGLGRFAGGNIKFFHLAAIGFIGVLALRPGTASSVVAVIRRYPVFYVSWVLYQSVLLAASLVLNRPYYPTNEAVRQVLYAFTGLFVAAFCSRLPSLRSRVWMPLAGLLTSAAVTVGLFVSAASNGVNPISMVSQALTSADPDVVGKLLRAAFRAQEFEDANLNLRHKVFGAVLVATFVGLAFTPASRGVVITGRSPARRLRRPPTWLTVAVGCGLTVLSLSRSVILALALAVGVAALRVLARGRLRPRQAVGVVAVASVLGFVVLSPAGVLLGNRFIDQTGSYESRVSSTVEFTDQFASSALIGGEVDGLDRSNPHNALLNAWLSGGVLAFVFGLGCYGAYMRLWLSQLSGVLFRPRRWLLGVDQLFVIAIGILPIVRIFTAAQGWHMNEWVAVGIVMGTVSANERAAASRLRADPSAPAGE